MVIAQVVHITNNTLREFEVTAGDVFGTPQVDDVPCRDGKIDVPPGFDQAVDGLSVPWATMTIEGLKITERDSDDLLRVLIGPREDDADNFDWLQFHGREWEPLGDKEHWIKIGSRHILGTVGGSADLQLTFRDGRRNADKPATLLEVTHFDHAVAVAPADTVFLNVFDLAPALSIPNAMLCNTVYNTLGAFHAAVEVYGEEWSFYRTPQPEACGVCRSVRRRHHPVHVFRQSVNVGRTSLRDWEVRYLIRGSLAFQWPGGGYDLLRRNCIHFCDELLLNLGVRQVPTWVKGLHETGATVLQLPWPLSLLGGDYGDQEKDSSYQVSADANEDPELALAALEARSQPPADGWFVDIKDEETVGAKTDAKLPDNVPTSPRQKSLSLKGPRIFSWQASASSS